MVFAERYLPIFVWSCLTAPLRINLQCRLSLRSSERRLCNFNPTSCRRLCKIPFFVQQCKHLLLFQWQKINRYYASISAFVVSYAIFKKFSLFFNSKKMWNEKKRERANDVRWVIEVQGHRSSQPRGSSTLREKSERTIVFRALSTSNVMLDGTGWSCLPRWRPMRDAHRWPPAIYIAVDRH